MAKNPNHIPPVDVLGVYLEPTPAESVRIGSLLHDQAGTVTFIVDESYIALGAARPVLSAAFMAASGEEETITRLRDRHQKTGTINVLPPFFSNLLPEGALRDVVEAQLPTGSQYEFMVLRQLGGDLPGAVVVRDEQVSNALPQRAPAVPREADNPALVKFSLAGVQMKFSMARTGERLTMPVNGQAGRVIAKLPSDRFPFLPEIEYSAMRLAAAAGVEAAEVSLFPASRIDDIHPNFLKNGEYILAVTRFDREGDRRIHIEDFAQVLGAVGNQKYSRANVETLARLAARFSPEPVQTVMEMVRRIVIDLMLGNGDNHLKNTSFIYPDGRTPRLSQAYDIVPTVLFNPNDSLALKFGGKRQFAGIGEREFTRMAAYVDVEARAVLKEIQRTVARANDTWPALMKELPWPDVARQDLANRWSNLPFFEGAGNPFIAQG